MKKESHNCLIAISMATIFLLIMVVLYGTINSQHPDSLRFKYDFQLIGSLPAPFKLDISWPKNPELFEGPVFGVAVNQYTGVVYVAQRGDTVPKVLVFTTSGDFLMSWNTSTLEMPHGIFLENPASNPTVWITDVGNGPYGHCIKQYSPSGKLIQVLGTPGKAGTSLLPVQFDQPAEVFVHSSGEIYIVDGDGGMNNRLIKLSRNLQLKWVHGEKGQGMAQFNIPHSVTVDAYQRVWVADRANNRIQVFSSVTGDWLGMWGSCFKEDAPYSVRLTPDRKYFVVVQLNINRILMLEAPPVGVIGQCRVASVIQLPDEVKPHLVDLDLKTGSLYVAEIGAQQAQKYNPI